MRATDAAATQLAVGETPKLAARLQGLAHPDQIMIGATTRRLLGAVFELDDLGTHALKGIFEPVQAFGVVALGRYEHGSKPHEGILYHAHAGAQLEADGCGNPQQDKTSSGWRCQFFSQLKRLDLLLFTAILYGRAWCARQPNTARSHHSSR